MPLQLRLYTHIAAAGIHSSHIVAGLVSPQVHIFVSSPPRNLSPPVEVDSFEGEGVAQKSCDILIANNSWHHDISIEVAVIPCDPKQQ